MNLSVGIVGLPNVGKSTTFNALTKTQNAQAENYPFCTIEPNKAVVPVPDERIEEISKIINPQKKQYSTIEIVDIAGLVKGASKGEGLGNQFLSNIREVEVILHMVRCFDDEDITHTQGDIEPLRDVEIIETELIFADLQSIEKKVARLEKMAKSNKDAKALLEMATDIQSHLTNLKPISVYDKKDDELFIELNKELRFLSNKTIIYIANVDENDVSSDEDNKYVKSLKEYASKSNSKVIKICAKIEEELIELSDEEALEMLNDLNIAQSGLSQIIKASFSALNLISYFTAGVKEVRAWTIQKDITAPKAASVIHNDFERGFIKAEVLAYDDFIECGGEANAKNNGKLRLEGKEYIVQDGDVMHFKFNV